MDIFKPKYELHEVKLSGHHPYHPHRFVWMLWDGRRYAYSYYLTEKAGKEMLARRLANV